MFLDESHFSTEPYVIRGWSKKGKPFFPVDPEKTRNPHNIWGICTSKRFFLLEEFKKSNAKEFKGFLHQLRARTDGKPLVSSWITHQYTVIQSRRANMEVVIVI